MATQRPPLAICRGVVRRRRARRSMPRQRPQEPADAPRRRTGPDIAGSGLRPPSDRRMARLMPSKSHRVRPFACPVLARNRVPTEMPAILRISTCCRQALGIFGGVPPHRLCGRPLQGRAAPQPSNNLFEYHAEIKQP